MRSAAVLLAIVVITGCHKAPAAGPPLDAEAPSARRIDVNVHTPYAGRWALDRRQCSDEHRIWTIEAHRMGIQPAMRFCAFGSMMLNQASASEEPVWSATADCLAEGRESKAFVFFRMRRSFRDMRVTFNDDAAVDLVRCPPASS